MKISSFAEKSMIKSMENALKSGKIPAPGQNDPLAPDSLADLNFIAWGDPQISFISPLRSARLFSACCDINSSNGKFDALVLLGDITEYGMKSEYKTAARLINLTGSKFDKVFAVPGNHDIRLRNYKRQIFRFANFLSLIPNSVKNSIFHYFHSYELKGYKFIFLGADKTCFESSYISDTQLFRLENELKTAPRDKPVFVFNHQALNNTNGLPETWLSKGNWRGGVGKESEKLKAVLETRNNVIFISGHLHYGTSKYTFEDLGKIKAVSVPTVGVLNHGEYNPLGQGIIFRVYKDKIVCKSRVFCEGRYVEDSVPNHMFEIKLN